MLRSAGLAGSLILAASTVPVFADAAALETVRTECGTQLNLPAAACDCIATRAGELSDEQQAFLAATVTKDEAATSSLRGQMTIEELTQVGMFMTSAPQNCVQGG